MRQSRYVIAFTASIAALWYSWSVGVVGFASGVAPVANWAPGELIPVQFTGSIYPNPNSMGTASSTRQVICRADPCTPGLFSGDADAFEGYYLSGNPTVLIAQFHNGGPWVGSRNDYNHPVYNVPRTAINDYKAFPRVRVVCTAGYGPGHSSDGCGARGPWRVPRFAHQAGGGDGHIAIIQPDGMSVVSMWQFDCAELSDSTGWSCRGQGHPRGFNDNDTVTASWGNVTRLDGLPDTVRDCGTAKWACADIAPGFTRGAATHGGVDLAASLTTVSELQDGIDNFAARPQGSISHALMVTLPCGADVRALWPSSAAGPDTKCASGGIPYGSRIWYDRGFREIDKLNTDPLTKVVLKALHKYGGYFLDVGGDGRSGAGKGFGLSFEGSTTYWSYRTDPIRAWITAYAAAWQPKFPAAFNNDAGQGRIQISPDSSVVGWSTHLHVLNPCVTGTGSGPSCSWPGR